MEKKDLPALQDLKTLGQDFENSRNNNDASQASFERQNAEHKLRLYSHQTSKDEDSLMSSFKISAGVNRSLFHTLAVFRGEIEKRDKVIAFLRQIHRVVASPAQPTMQESRDSTLEEAVSAIWQYKAGETISTELMLEIGGICALVRSLKSKPQGE